MVNQPRKAWFLVGALCCVLLVAAVWYTVSPLLKSDVRSSVVEDQVVTLDQPISLKSTPQRVGDPVRGRTMMLAGGYNSCGIPSRVFEQVFATPPELKLPDRAAADRDLPYFSNRVTDKNNVELITNNCLSCHATPLFGEIIVGLGNEFLGFSDPGEMVDRAGLLVRGEHEIAAWEKFADRMDVVSQYTQAATVGVNVANNLTFALMSHFDPQTLRWSDSPLIEPPDQEPLPVSVPPWWRMSKKNALFYQGQGQGDHSRIMILAALLCADGVDDVQAADDYAPDIYAYIASLQAPKYPFPVDSVLSDAGRVVFEQTCSRCHGTYGADATYPNLLVPLTIVGTDPALAQQAIDYRRFDDWFAASWYAKDTRIAPANGYMAPPLDGIWATGPFLHNGSVPTIELVLNSAERPTRWRHLAAKQYDQRSLGWRFDAVEALPAGVDERQFYMTDRLGYGNGGHQFGDHLTDADRLAVLEYLKTL